MDEIGVNRVLMDKIGVKNRIEFGVFHTQCPVDYQQKKPSS